MHARAHMRVHRHQQITTQPIKNKSGASHRMMPYKWGNLGHTRPQLPHMASDGRPPLVRFFFFKFTHFLVQANPHAVFSYHDDAFDMQLSKRMLTVIVSLNCNVSGVEILGFKPVWYTGCGEAVAFMGAAIHRSVMPDTYTHKTASCMFAPTKKSSCLSSGVELSKAPVKVAMFFD